MTGSNIKSTYRYNDLNLYFSYTPTGLVERGAMYNFEYTGYEMETNFGFKDSLPYERWVRCKRSDSYFISSKGRVLSIISEKQPKLLTPVISDKGYAKVYIYEDWMRKEMYVSRLVAQCFLQDYDDSKVIFHSDGDILNNTEENLILVSKSQLAREAKDPNYLRPCCVFPDNVVYPNIYICSKDLGIPLTRLKSIIAEKGNSKYTWKGKSFCYIS